MSVNLCQRFPCPPKYASVPVFISRVYIMTQPMFRMVIRLTKRSVNCHTASPDSVPVTAAAAKINGYTFPACRRTRYAMLSLP